MSNYGYHMPPTPNMRRGHAAIEADYGDDGFDERELPALAALKQSNLDRIERMSVSLESHRVNSHDIKYRRIPIFIKITFRMLRLLPEENLTLYVKLMRMKKTMTLIQES